MAVPFLLIVWTLIIEQAKKLCRTSQLLSLSLKRELMFLAVLVLDKTCTFWLSWNGIIFLFANILLTSCQGFMLYRVPNTKEIILPMLDT